MIIQGSKYICDFVRVGPPDMWMVHICHDSKQLAVGSGESKREAYLAAIDELADYERAHWNAMCRCGDARLFESRFEQPASA